MGKIWAHHRGNTDALREPDLAGMTGSQKIKEGLTLLTAGANANKHETDKAAAELKEERKQKTFTDEYMKLDQRLTEEEEADKAKEDLVKLQELWRKEEEKTIRDLGLKQIWTKEREEEKKLEDAEKKQGDAIKKQWERHKWNTEQLVHDLQKPLNDDEMKSMWRKEFEDAARLDEFAEGMAVAQKKTNRRFRTRGSDTDSSDELQGEPDNSKMRRERKDDRTMRREREDDRKMRREREDDRKMRREREDDRKMRREIEDDRRKREVDDRVSKAYDQGLARRTTESAEEEERRTRERRTRDREAEDHEYQRRRERHRDHEAVNRGALDAVDRKRLHAYDRKRNQRRENADISRLESADRDSLDAYHAAEYRKRNQRHEEADLSRLELADRNDLDAYNAAQYRKRVIREREANDDANRLRLTQLEETHRESHPSWPAKEQDATYQSMIDEISYVANHGCNSVKATGKGSSRGKNCSQFKSDADVPCMYYKNNDTCSELNQMADRDAKGQIKKLRRSPVRSPRK